MIEEADESRFLRARAGYMLMLPFQCEICHYRNSTKRDPNERDFKDAEALEYISRETLDSIWSREPATVKENLQGILRIEGTMLRLNLPPMLNFLGPFPLEDIHGMQATTAVLDRLLDKGLYEAQVQWETFRNNVPTSPTPIKPVEQV
jgi:hypothetical protein